MKNNPKLFFKNTNVSKKMAPPPTPSILNLLQQNKNNRLRNRLNILQTHSTLLNQPNQAGKIDN